MNGKHMDARQYASSTRQLRRHCDRLLGAGCHCAFVHALPNGTLVYYGSTVVTDVIHANIEVIKTDKRWNDAPPTIVQEFVQMPNLDIPIEKMSLLQLRRLVPSLIKLETGRQQIGWGKKQNKPKWWPEYVPFVNVNQKPVNFEGEWITALRCIANACFQHHLGIYSASQTLQQSNTDAQRNGEEANSVNINMECGARVKPVSLDASAHRGWKRRNILSSYSESADGSPLKR